MFPGLSPISRFLSPNEAGVCVPMASIETRRDADGVPTSWRVIWREAGQKRSQRVASLEQAQLWKAVLEAAGHDTDRAAAALSARASTPPPCATSPSSTSTVSDRGPPSTP